MSVTHWLSSKDKKVGNMETTRKRHNHKPQNTPRFKFSPEHYKEVDGHKFLVGIFSLQQRQAFIDVHKSIYKTKFPDADARTAKERAHHKWHNVVMKAVMESKTRKPKQ